MTAAAASLDAAANRSLIALIRAAAIWFGVFLSGFVLAEPAPYEIFMVALIGVWIVFGLTVPRSAVFVLLLLVAFNLGGVVSMFQMTEWGGAPLYLAVSLFLALTTVFLASVLASDHGHLALVFGGWTAAAVLTGLAGIAGYLELLPGSDAFTLHGRAKGAFEDPNVFAPYLALPAVYSLYRLLEGQAERALIAVPVFAILTLAIFLSFSRGGWALYAGSTALLLAIMFLSNNSGRFRLRLVLISAATLLAILAGIAVALQVDALRDLFVERAQLVQDYDAGRHGRFGRHWAGLLAAIEQPLGIGPMQFGKIYGEDPHNIWLKALFDYSWLGFAAYLSLIVATIAGGARLLFRRRPWQPYLQCAFVVFLGHVALGMVIDTDHWRHFYILLGIVWGCIALEARHGMRRETFGPSGQRQAVRP